MEYPINHDNTPEYYDACDEDDFVNDEEPEFKCDGCGNWFVVSDEEPFMVEYDGETFPRCLLCYVSTMEV